jgi:hypothetical protein
MKMWGKKILRVHGAEDSCRRERRFGEDGQIDRLISKGSSGWSLP